MYIESNKKEKEKERKLNQYLNTTLENIEFTRIPLTTVRIM